MRGSIFWKIVSGFSMLLLLMIGLGLYELYMLDRIASRCSALILQNLRLVNDVRSLQVDFKRQVQEWKNILLRGHVPEDFEKYLAAFQEKYAQVQADAEALKSAQISAESLNLLEQFIVEHQQLQQDYLKSLEVFQREEEHAYQAADHHVRGQDRPPTKLLDTFVDRIIEETHQRVQALEQEVARAQNWSGGLLLCLVALFILTALIIARKFSAPLKDIRHVLQEVSNGNIHVSSHVDTNDEIGDLARATQNMIEYLQHVASATERVSRREFDVAIVPRSEHDLLNHSLNKMVETLRTTIQELETLIQNAEQQNWIKDGLNQLNALLSGQLSLAQAAGKAIGFAARYTNAGHGVLYTYHAEKNILSLSGTFAFTEHDELAQEVRLGEGIVGQAAKDRTPIMLANVVRQDTEITTGTFSETPLHTYTSPLLYNDELYGVLELAANEPFEGQQQNFLESANRVISTALFSAMQREQIQKIVNQ